MKLICVFVFAYAKIRFSHDEAQLETDSYSQYSVNLTQISLMDFPILINMGESTFNFRGIRSYSFFYEIHASKQSSPRLDVLRRNIWGYSVCPCPIKRMPGLYGLRCLTMIIKAFLVLKKIFFKYHELKRENKSF